MASSSRDLPSLDQIWREVHDYALMCKEKGIRICTLQRFVPNEIVHVGDTVIERKSTRGTTQSAHITRNDVKRVWAEICESETHESSTKGDARVFTHALMLTALRTRVEPRGVDAIGLIGHGVARVERLPAFAREDVDYTSRAGGRSGGGGEGPTHRGIRLFIHEQPNEALVGLAGGPWTSYATEYELATRDRIDVVVRDSKGRFVLIEVKPWLANDEEYEQSSGGHREDARAPYAQAAKYRSQWHILREMAIKHLRCVVAAPRIPVRLAETMARDHEIESVAVVLPTHDSGSCGRTETAV